MRVGDQTGGFRCRIQVVELGYQLFILGTVPHPSRIRSHVVLDGQVNLQRHKTRPFRLRERILKENDFCEFTRESNFQVFRKKRFRGQTTAGPDKMTRIVSYIRELHCIRYII
jgi:hypothetical protein